MTLGKKKNDLLTASMMVLSEYNRYTENSQAP